ncbi:DUF6161 domain-containing protein [Ferruginibacter sp. HRS2-29]|uniref:DUF6161 domain-containing protein n=1 Tax=Ferruginibacter sp. HRS2-29 TaxID=2487334 RepID=UPI0020CEDF55|nr:DUF6161 domain-containing protein [Ferruginibacter sp. HRS2-29]MCP9752648.1 hypothetical protein [Ferruginibacter sp. HRS2-29]
MTLKELQHKIAESVNKDFYQGYKLEVKFPHVNYLQPLVGVAAIYEYILNQIEKFDEYSLIPSEIKPSKDLLKGLQKNIIALVTRDENYPSYWSDNLSSLKNGQPHIFLPAFSETEFLINLSKENNVHYAGAYEFLSGNMHHVNHKNYFIGYILAYEFVSKNFSKIAERKDSEKKSILTTATNFQKKLGEAENEVIEYIANTNEKFNQYAEKIDVLKSQKEEEFSNWFKGTTSKFNSFNTDSNKKITELESLYIEKLKLEAPAQYWNKRATKLRKEGNRWLIGMILCLVVSVFVLAFILNMVADGTLQKIFAETTTAIKWSVTFITLISFLAYGLRTFAKLTFSSFHLVRDAEEREQLTYVYLALKKEQNIDQTERHLIMQSLFSRADSGLLRDDSGPTMPGNIVDQVTKR